MPKEFIALSSVLLFLIFNFNNIHSQSDVKNLDNPKIIELINKLQGGTPKKTIKMFEGDILNINKENGENDKLSNYAGKIILLNLWATWCGYCIKEMPSMEKLYNELKNKDFFILAVSIGEDIDTVKKFVESNKFSFPVFTDVNDSINNNYNSGSFPTTYIIDKDGYIIARFIGARDWYSQDAIDLIKELTK